MNHEIVITYWKHLNHFYRQMTDIYILWLDGAKVDAYWNFTKSNTEHPHEDEIEEAKRNLLPNLRTKKVQNMIKQGKVIRQKHNRYECREDGTIDVYRKEISDDELYQIRGEFLKGKKLAKIEKRKKQINKIFEGVE